MLSLILFRIFRLCGILVLLAGLTTIIAQLLQKPIRIPTNRGFIALAEPGIRVTAQRSNIAEQMAPDTTVTYVFRNGIDHVTVSGTLSSKFDMRMERQALNKVIDSGKSSHQQFQSDTLISLIGQLHPETNPLAGDPGIIMEDSSENGKQAYAAAVKAAKLKKYMPVNPISEENDLSATLNILPANGWQVAGFILYDITRFACLTLLFFCLARLFRNFSRKDFFTAANVSLLKRTGWCLLLPALAAGLLYWIFLFTLQPVKLVLGADESMATLATYDISSGINWMLIVLGAGLLVMAYIFADAFEIKEDREFII